MKENTWSVVDNVNRDVFLIFAQVPDFTTGLLGF
jgi:hypothetical protein